MMERLREGVNSIAVKIILGLIILSFVFAGIGSYLVNGSSNAAAKVGNVEISRGDFEQAYQNERNRMQSQLGDYFSNLLSDPEYVASFRKSVLDRMINDSLLEQHAESLGLRVSDAQVRQMILDMPQFQTDGKFDQQVYQSALRRVGYTPEGFAELLRQDLVRNQLLTAVQGSDFSLKSEIAAQGQLVTQTRDIRTITLNVDDYASKVSPSDEQVQAYYDEHQDNYARPEQMKVAYVELSADALKKNVSVTDADAKAYYDAHQDKYSTAEQRKISHILVKGDDEAKAQAILDELNAGANFADLAKQKSEDVGSAENGGSLGWIERDVMDPAFEKAAFALKNVGDMSGLVKSNFGYHIIKLDDLKAPKAKPYADVKSDIIAEIADQQALDKFYDLQSQLETVAFESPDSLDEAAKVIGQPIKQTDFISEQDAPDVLNTPKVMEALNTPEVKEDGLNSEVIEVGPEHVIVVRAQDVRPETVLPLEDVRADVVSALAHSEGEKQAMSDADTLVAGLQKGDPSVLKSHDVKFGELEKIDRRSPLAERVFSMPKPEEGESSYAQTQDADGNIVVVALSGVEAKVDESLNERVGKQLVQMNAQQDLTGLVNILRKNTDIKYYALGQ
ncbi:peptidyl-prolyl cis-trans isomerase D [Vibrio xiamenensis]|uniref:Periplasmic chaperone PpiD n=1 Tax=Vibrio xiamenensis TaxID=861298 RepID=A0A1G7ZC60_9VIBR|nr:peptidylprolyl isomerase [Vibrio xiamenensis]SDH06167.1 peptidyl-prolyl cis-trans isomerase D [Vibrio xiamenensis]